MASNPTVTVDIKFGPGAKAVLAAAKYLESRASDNKPLEPAGARELAKRLRAALEAK